MSTTTTVMTLTAEDLTALRTASDVSFHTHARRAFIRAHTTSDNERTFTKRQQLLFPEFHTKATRVREIACQAVIAGYEKGNYWRALDDDPMPAAFVSVFNNRDEMQTIWSLLRVGDEITLSWLGGNDNDHLEHANLHHDELRLFARRAGRTRPLAFNVYSGVYADNSARMVKHYG